MPMTSRERIARILRHEPADRVGLYEGYWATTIARWRQEGHLRADEDPNEHFNLDIAEARPFNLNADPAFGRKLIIETPEYIDYLDGNGSTLRKVKSESGAARQIAFSIRERADWEARVKPYMGLVRERINLDVYRKQRDLAAARGRFFCLGSRFVFQMIQMICGHEYQLMGMALDPDWMREMSDTYADLFIRLMEALFAEAGRPDGLWLNDDLGFKEKPFMSNAMFLDLFAPAYRRVFRYAHAQGLPVILHSCGFVEPLVGDLVETGIDCLQAIEVKAGMDPLRLKQRFGDRLALCGGMDARVLIANDRGAVRRELAAKLPALVQGSGYILHSDHSITHQVDYETYRFFLEEGLRMGTTSGN